MITVINLDHIGRKDGEYRYSTLKQWLDGMNRAGFSCNMMRRGEVPTPILKLAEEKGGDFVVYVLKIKPGMGKEKRYTRKHWPKYAAGSYAWQFDNTIGYRVVSGDEIEFQLERFNAEKTQTDNVFD